MGCEELKGVESDVPPEVLYKYLPPVRIDAVRALEIRFSQASSLNDTLELKPPTNGVASPQRLREIVRERLEPGLWSQTSPENKRIVDERFPGLSDTLGEVFLQQYTAKGCGAIESRFRANPLAVFETTDRNFGILSLTESATDVRMWSHYADGGRGFLLGFNSNHPWFHGKLEAHDSFRHLRKVRYVSSRPTKYLLEATESEFLYTKWAVWQDEREWRIIRNFNDASRRLNSRDPYGNDILLFSIPADAIRTIIVGFSAGEELEAGLCSLITEDPNLNHVKVARAVQSNETGEIRVGTGEG